MTYWVDQADLIANFEATREKGVVSFLLSLRNQYLMMQALFHESRVLVEKFITRARHIEVQIFGNGRGHVVHAGERECSVQRRHQKVIEESPCVLFATEKGQRESKYVTVPTFRDTRRHVQRSSQVGSATPISISRDRGICPGHGFTQPRFLFSGSQCSYPVGSNVAAGLI